MKTGIIVETIVGDETVWTSGNDGAGSGLDADKIDGIEASSLAPANHNHDLLYAPASTISDVRHVFTQTEPSTEWIVDHTLGKNPSVEVVDTAGSRVQGDIKYESITRIVLSFMYPFAGKAYLN